MINLALATWITNIKTTLWIAFYSIKVFYVYIFNLITHCSVLCSTALYQSCKTGRDLRPEPGSAPNLI